MPVLEGVFHQVAAVLLVCAVIGAVAARLRQPLIVAFIAAGILVGPRALAVVDDPTGIDLLAKIGIALLLFVVGLKLDVTLVRTVGPVALATGLGQVAFTSAVGFGIAMALGMDVVTATYVAVALTFSSTIIIVKLLSDKEEIEELHGRIAIGFLIVQDVVVVIVMIVLSAVGGAEGEVGVQLLLVVLRAVSFLAVLGILMKWVLPPLLHRLAHLPELLMLFAIAWAVSVAAVGDILGFSEEVGAFLAGVSLASTPYRDAIGARLVSLRDFLLLFFFIALGARLDLAGFGDQVVPAVVLSLFVLIGNPVLVMIVMGFMGYHRHVSFRCGLVVAQISEFSLILASLGLALGHIGDETVGLITAVGLITIGLSTYLIYNSDAIYERLSGPLHVFQREPVRHDDPEADEFEPEVIVFGLGRYGGAIVEQLHEAGIDVLGIDFDPRALELWRGRGVRVLYGDAEDPDLPEALPFSRTRWVVSTSRRRDTNLSLIQALQHHGYEGKVAVAAAEGESAEVLRESGADHVLLPYTDAATDAVSALRGED